MITCIHCRMQFHAGTDEGGRPILGLTEEQKLMDLVKRATEHLNMAHRDELGKAAIYGQTLTTLAVVCNFESQDLFWIQRRLLAAAQLSSFTRRVLTDQEIKRAVDRAAGGSDGKMLTVEQGVFLVQQLRDYLYYEDVLHPAKPAEGAPPA